MKSWKSSTPLLVGYAGKNYLLADASDTPATKAWQSRWGGHWDIVRSINDALGAIGASNDK